MEQANKIQSIKDLFKNTCDTLSRDEINDIRLKIYKNTKLYDYYANKKELNKKQQKWFNEIINNLIELHEYLSNKANNEDNANYELDKLFDDNIYYKPIQIKGAFYENYPLISFVDNTESQIMHSKSDNVEIMSGYDTDNFINMLIDTFTKRYQQGLETKMKGSSYVFDRIELLEYHFHKITLNRGSP